MLPDSPIENIDHNLRRKRGSSSSSEAEEEEGEDEQCGAAFFGIQDKYENIHVQSCAKKMCTACEIANRSELSTNIREVSPRKPLQL